MRRTARWSLYAVAALLALVLIVIVSLSLMNRVQQHRARGLLEAVRGFQLGKTRSAEAIALARKFDFDTEVRAWVDEPTSTLLDRGRLNECERAGCAIDIVLLLPGQYVAKDWFPRTSDSLIRYVPQKMVFARIGVENGVVTRVSALIELHDDKPYYDAAGVIYSSERTANLQLPPGWSIVTGSGHFKGGYWGGKYNSINVHADESVPFEQIHRVFDFNSRCLGLWAHCEPCEMLKAACEEHERMKKSGDLPSR